MGVKTSLRRACIFLSQVYPKYLPYQMLLQKIITLRDKNILHTTNCKVSVSYFTYSLSPLENGDSSKLEFLLNMVH